MEGQEYPDCFYCSITHEIMANPVIDHEGNTYEKSAIVEWLKNNRTSPLTRNYLDESMLRQNRALKQIIAATLGDKYSPINEEEEKIDRVEKSDDIFMTIHSDIIWSGRNLLRITALGRSPSRISLIILLDSLEENSKTFKESLIAFSERFGDGDSITLIILSDVMETKCSVNMDENGKRVIREIIESLEYKSTKTTAQLVELDDPTVVLVDLKKKRDRKIIIPKNSGIIYIVSMDINNYLNAERGVFTYVPKIESLKDIMLDLASNIFLCYEKHIVLNVSSNDGSISSNYKNSSYEETERGFEIDIGPIQFGQTRYFLINNPRESDLHIDCHCIGLRKSVGMEKQEGRMDEWKKTLSRDLLLTMLSKIEGVPHKDIDLIESRRGVVDSHQFLLREMVTEAVKSKKDYQSWGRSYIQFLHDYIAIDSPSIKINSNDAWIDHRSSK